MIACGIASEGPTTPYPISGERQRSEVSKQQECPETWSSDAKQAHSLQTTHIT